MTKRLDVIALGSCYVDFNAPNYPFSEAGIPSEVELVGSTYEMVPGGSAVNFCVLLERLGLSTGFIGMAGDDPVGKLFDSLLRQAGVLPLMVQDAGLATNVSFGMTNPHGSHIMLVAGTANAALSPEAVLPKVEATIADARVLFIGGCFKLQTFEYDFHRLAEMAAANDASVVVDHNRIPKHTSPGMLEAVRALVLQSTFYLPSREEFCQLWGVDSIEAGLQLLHNKAPGLGVVVKDGANGAYYFANGAVRHVPAEPAKGTINATGAGDSFNAGFMTAIIGDRPIAAAATYACKVAAAKITGQSIPSLS